MTRGRPGENHLSLRRRRGRLNNDRGLRLVGDDRAVSRRLSRLVVVVPGVAVVTTAAFGAAGGGAETTWDSGSDSQPASSARAQEKRRTEGRVTARKGMAEIVFMSAHRLRIFRLVANSAGPPWGNFPWSSQGHSFAAFPDLPLSGQCLG